VHFSSVRWEHLTTYLKPLLAVVFSLLVAGLFVLMAGASPLEAYRYLIEAGFGCHATRQCALLTTLQFSTPLILTGLSAAVALRAGMFSIGQAGQMLLGAAAGTWLGARLGLPPFIHPAVALAGGAVAGALWGWIPGLLKSRLEINEVVVTLVMNQLAGLLVGLVWLPRIRESARLAPLAFNTKLSLGFFLALAMAVLTSLYLWRTGAGYTQRMAGQAPWFALAGGIHPQRAVERGMLLSGALAGLAGAVEVLGVHYRFVSVFSGGGGFDGIAVGLLGQANPLGTTLAGILLAGLRVGATNGLQLKVHVPRELGGAMIAMMILFVSAEWLYRQNAQHIRVWARRLQGRLAQAHNEK
jgi:simple sugar transport system permease protein